MSDILDFHLQHVMKRILRRHCSKEQLEQLKSIYLCQEKIHPRNVTGKKTVFLVRGDNERSGYYGQAHCRNPFCCPVCTAKAMEGYRSRIASAIDMLKGQGYFGFMATFTVAHLKSMSCREVTDILYDTWKYFRMKNFQKKFHVSQEFFKDVEVSDWVRVCEYTYGVNGWHPHFHCIYWIPRSNVDKVLDWENALSDYWVKIAKFIAVKYWRANNLHTDKNLDDLAKDLFEPGERAGKHSVRFSRDKNGKLLEVDSSNYLTGWSADRELTGNIRKSASHAGHYTPYQILQMAEHDDKWAQVYVDFVLGVTKKPVHHRVNFSKRTATKPSLSARVDEYRKTHKSKYVLDEKKTTWRVVTYFDEFEWWNLCRLNRTAPVFENILYLARKPDYEDLLFEYLKFLHLKPRRRIGDGCLIPSISRDEYKARMLSGDRSYTEFYTETREKIYIPVEVVNALRMETACKEVEAIYNVSEISESA